jgi:hypothetical protein
MKQKKIWSQDTAVKVAQAKAAKHGGEWRAAPAIGGGFTIEKFAWIPEGPEEWGDEPAWVNEASPFKIVGTPKGGF